ncbi:MAG TPA: PilZ domain-containing protein [Steroidobacteraceae bacterium]|jgi:hypothetical protein|nr:PilZ domain-containing protein [Steroidobacteraceae bacterium]
MDHRWGERLQVDFPVRVTTHRFSVRDGRVADMSVSGALVEGDLPARMLSRIHVAIVLPLRPKHEFPVVQAYVARKYKHGFGIEWCEFAPDPIRRLLGSVAARPHTRFRRHAASASLTVSRLSSPLLKHGS